MEKLFGTDGIRGKAGEYPLDARTVQAIGELLAVQFAKETESAARFILGRDTRDSGSWIEQAFVAGASARGAKCKSAGVITTPGVAYLARVRGFDAGIVISASHNVYSDNGLKVFLPTGKKLDSVAESEIEAELVDHIPAEIASHSVDDSNAASFQDEYLDHLADSFSGLDLSKKKIVLDCANGAASKLAPRLFRDFGAEVVAINNNPDGVNINKDCGSLHLETLRKEVLNQKADFGVAFDGDADRALFVNEKGEVLDGDGTLWILARHLRNQGKLADDLVVATVMSNIGLEIALKSENIRMTRTDVGDKYVLDKLIETGAVLGGEQSGHIIVPQTSLVGDGMQTVLLVAEALVVRDCSLSSLAKGFTQYPQVLVNVVVSEKPAFEELAEVRELETRILNELGDSGRLLLRYSGTENLARVMIEGEDLASIKLQANELANVIGAAIG